jgi:hypothetical protein
MYAGRSAARNMNVASFGDVTVELVRTEIENGNSVRVYRMYKEGSEIGQARESTDENWRFYTTLLGRRSTASKYTVSM